VSSSEVSWSGVDWLTQSTFVQCEVREVNGSQQPYPDGGPAYAQSLIGWTHLIYALHAFSLITGIFTTASVVLAFLTGWPSIIAVVLNYLKRNEARGTWLDSHFQWQIRTFWWGLLWVSLCFLIGLVFVVLTVGIGLLVVWIPFGIVGLWFIYRIVKGWRALSNRQMMYR
jgi:uncharacterized membrane protein